MLTDRTTTYQFVVTFTAPFPMVRTEEEQAERDFLFALDGFLSTDDRFALGATVERIANKHAEQFHSAYGMPYDCGMPAPVMVYPEGIWEYDHDGLKADGLCLQELVDFVRRNGGNPAKNWY